MGSDPSFPCYLVRSIPGESPSMTITLWRAVFDAASGLVRQASVTKKSAMSPFDMNIF